MNVLPAINWGNPSDGQTRNSPIDPMKLVGSCLIGRFPNNYRLIQMLWSFRQVTENDIFLWSVFRVLSISHQMRTWHHNQKRLDRGTKAFANSNFYNIQYLDYFNTRRQ